MKSLENDKQVAIDIFKYLEKLFSINLETKYDFRNLGANEAIYKIEELPLRAPNLYVKNLDEDSESSDIFLSVKKTPIEKVPTPPEILHNWVDVEDTHTKKPEHKESIIRRVAFSENEERKTSFQEFKRGANSNVPHELQGWVIQDENGVFQEIEERDIKFFFDDYPELENACQGYIEGPWEEWRRKNEPKIQANGLYTRLYGLRNFIKQDGDSFDLYWTHDVLTWHKDGEKIFHPFFFTPLCIEFNAEEKEILVRQDDESTFIETSFLDKLNIPLIEDLHTEARVLKEGQFDVWNSTYLDMEGKKIVGFLSSDGTVDISHGDVEEPGIGEQPHYAYYPTICLRKKTSYGWVKYAQKIQDDIKEVDTLPSFVSQLAGSSDEEEKQETPNEGVPSSTQDGELYFPLPWNEEQAQIVKHFDNKHGVVVQGPPGTGKSHTIANLLSRFLAQGKSVLVTSQKGKALEVLRNKLPENLRDLAVSYTGDDYRTAIQTSVNAINTNLNDDRIFTEEREKELLDQLKEIRKEKAVINKELRRWRVLDIEEILSLGGEVLKPIPAAKEFNEHQNNNWIPGKISEDTEINFSSDDITEAVDLLSTLNESERQYFNQWVPSLNELPSENDLLKSFIEFSKANNEQDRWLQVLDSHRLKKQSVVLDIEEVRNIYDLTKKSIDTLQVIDSEWEKNLFRLVQQNTEELTLWKDIIYEKLKNEKNILRELQEHLIGHEVYIEADLSIDDCAIAIKEIQEKVAQKGSIGRFQKALLSKNARAVFANSSITPNDLPQADKVELIQRYIESRQRLNNICLLWNQSFHQSEIEGYKNLDPNITLHELEVEIENLARVVNYSETFVELKQFIGRYSIFNGYEYDSQVSLEEFRNDLESFIASYRAEGLDRMFDEMQAALDKEGAHIVVQDIKNAIAEKNSEVLISLYGQIPELLEKQAQSCQLEDIRQKISKYAPELYKSIVESVENGGEFPMNCPVEQAWRLSRIDSWLERIHSGESVSMLQKRLQRVKNEENDNVAELISVKSWINLKSRVTPEQKRALASYANAMRHMPRNRNAKTRLHWEREAQSSLNEAKEAVPIWIMPAEQVINMFPSPEAGLFDVVIFDEASQMDVRGIEIAYLGKKVLVVGDEEQTSPETGGFIKHEEVSGLISQYLSQVPRAANYTLRTSLVGLSKIIFNSQIMLREHFRSVPEIINFSNELSYEGKLIPLRFPQPQWKITPVLEKVYVEEGYMNSNNKQNEPEAERLVAKLEEMIEDPQYDLRSDEKGGSRYTSFGVVTLLGNDQGKKIEQLISERISEEEIEKRKIIVGNPYRFQGDERDIMLISMVQAPNSDDPGKPVRPLTENTKSNKQRVNVALSRARDKEVLFYSIPDELLTNSVDLRARIVNWFSEQKQQEIYSGKETLKKEYDRGRASEFELEVGNIIINNGYRIIPQYEVAGKRIDMVIQGENARLAVECDGDQYHGPDKWDEDIQREEMLKRVGWEFWRIAGSAFYQNQEHALDSLWEKLEGMGINPSHGDLESQNNQQQDMSTSEKDVTSV